MWSKFLDPWLMKTSSSMSSFTDNQLFLYREGGKGGEREKEGGRGGNGEGEKEEERVREERQRGRKWGGGGKMRDFSLFSMSKKSPVSVEWTNLGQSLQSVVLW